MHIDTGELEEKLGIPVIPTAARSGKGLKLKAAIDDLICGRITPGLAACAIQQK